MPRKREDKEGDARVTPSGESPVQELPWQSLAAESDEEGEKSIEGATDG